MVFPFTGRSQLIGGPIHWAVPFSERSEGDYSKETSRRSGAHDIFGVAHTIWFGAAHTIFCGVAHPILFGVTHTIFLVLAQRVPHNVAKTTDHLRNAQRMLGTSGGEISEKN